VYALVNCQNKEMPLLAFWVTATRCHVVIIPLSPVHSGSLAVATQLIDLFIQPISRLSLIHANHLGVIQTASIVIHP
jgi:hypothetical protein